MIKTITLENFKAFKKLDNLNIKPITILCGTNSCGKSSILQSILFLKQTLESKNSHQIASLNGRLARFGIIDNVIFEKRTNKNVVLKYSFEISYNTDLVMFEGKNKRSINWIIDKINRSIKREGIIKERDLNSLNLEYSISLGKVKESESVKYENLIVKQFIIKIYVKTKNNEKKLFTEASINYNSRNKKYTLKYEDNFVDIISRSVNRDTNNLKEPKYIEVDFSNLFPTFFNKNESDIIDDSKIRTRFAWMNDALRSIFSTYSYIGPLREEPARRYIYEDEVIEIGNEGENAAYIFSTENNKKIQPFYFYDYDDKKDFRKIRNATLKKGVIKWLELMDITNLNDERKNEIIYLTLNSNSSKKTNVNIADVGFGVSQIFPIIVEGLRMNVGNTLLLEQPEIHLHPKLQMQMADYFISLALSGKNVIVETHSDHIINRLIRRIVEDNSHNLKDLVEIYFIESSKEGSTVKPIEIDETRGIRNWPNGFFDQVAEEQKNTILAGIKKRKNNQ